MKRFIYFLIIISMVTMLSECQEEPADGKNSLMELNAEPAGENCQSGGFKISTGLDLNENNFLEESEVQYEEYLCNGSDGQNGQNGQNGQSGQNGENGLNSLVNILVESPGEYCDNGGIRLETGLDANINGVLDAAEVQAINYICNGVDGQSEGSVSMVRIPFTLAYKWRLCELGWTSEVEDGLLYNFNINAYEGFDSAIFVSQFFRSIYDNDKIWLRLYDYTSNGDIGGSELYSDTPNPQITDPDMLIHRSGNFISSFMPGPRTIGIQFRKEAEQARAISIHHAEILLIKSN